MPYRFYSPENGFSKKDVDRGYMWVYADVECPHCGKVQSVAATSYVGGPCVQCGELTGGK